MKKSYKNVDEAIRDLSEVLPMLRELRATAARNNDTRILADVAKLERLFADDARLLRSTLEPLKNPDGSLEFGFSPEAADLLRPRNR